MRNARLLATAVTLGAVLFSHPGTAQNPLRPAKKALPGATAPAAPSPKPGSEAENGKLPRLRLGALLPLTGPSAWYGEEMRHGMELAVADLGPPPAGGPSTSASTIAGRADREAAPAGQGDAQEAASPSTLQIALEVLDVRPLDVRDAEADFRRLAAGGATVILTASPTPTLAIYPLAAARDILVVHQGLPTDRFPVTSQTLLHTRPAAATRGDTLAAYAWERGIRRLALLAAGDEFGRAVRAAVAARWRERGGSLVDVESLSLDAPDLAGRLGRLARLAPDAICLAFRGPELGDLARHVREAGYRGLLLALDNDRAALLAAGPALMDAVFLADAFVPEPESRGARFAKAYEAKYKHAPSHFAANAYDAVSMLVEGARRALQEGRGLPGGARLRETLMSRRTFPSVYGGQIAIRDDGTVSHPLALFAVDAGRPMFVRYVVPLGGSPTEEGKLPSTTR